MKVQIESVILGYSDTYVIAELNSLISLLNNVSLKIVKNNLKDYESEYFFLYLGGNHIAVHQKINGVIKENRLLFCTEK